MEWGECSVKGGEWRVESGDFRVDSGQWTVESQVRGTRTLARCPLPEIVACPEGGSGSFDVFGPEGSRSLRPLLATPEDRR